MHAILSYLGNMWTITLVTLEGPTVDSKFELKVRGSTRDREFGSPACANGVYTLRSAYFLEIRDTYSWVITLPLSKS